MVSGKRRKNWRAEPVMLQIGDLIQRYQSNAEDRPSTIRNNSSSLRLLIRTVHGGDPDQRSSALLTGDLIREFERIRRTTATTESARRRARAKNARESSDEK